MKYLHHLNFDNLLKFIFIISSLSQICDHPSLGGMFISISILIYGSFKQWLSSKKPIANPLDESIKTLQTELNHLSQRVEIAEEKASQASFAAGVRKL